MSPASWPGFDWEGFSQPWAKNINASSWAPPGVIFMFSFLFFGQMNISGSARQQAGAAADVTRRTAKLREISEQTGKATTATAAAISKLSEFATQLRKSVAGFTLPGAGGGMAGTTRITPQAEPVGKPPETKVSAG